MNFIELAWEILEPGRDFVSGWHIHAIADHLTAVSEGDITRLLMNVPPGCMKSLTTEVFWPAWEWGPRNHPELRYVGASYSQDLTLRDNRKCRNLILSEWYQRLWGDRFNLVADQNTKTRFDTSKAGFKVATSVSGLGTGERGDRFIIDDPHNVKDGESDAKRLETELWFTETVPTRVNDPETSSIIVIMQRIHERDVSGLILEKELDYTHLCLPMEYEPERKCFTSIGFEDPREEEGELLWSDRMTRQVVERDKKILGGYGTAGQFQQRPAPRGGGLFNRDWFEIVDAAPKSGRVCRGWDLAATEKVTAAYTAGVKIRRTDDGIFWVEHVNRFRGSPGRVETAIVSTANEDGKDVRISIPQDPGQAGKAQVRYLAMKLAGYEVRFSPETGSKEVRANPASAQAEAGNVKLVRGPWNTAFLDELCVFPMSQFKDQVDGFSRAFSELLKKGHGGVPAAPKMIGQSNG